MERTTSRDGAVVSYQREGAGPPLVLVHGSFSDHVTNWMHVMPRLRERFTVYTVARRGRGETVATDRHRLEDEAGDVVAVVEAAREPVRLLGHSYGALCALGAAAMVPERVAQLVLYEPAWPTIVSADLLARLEALGARERWDAVAETFMTEALRVAPEEVAALRQTSDWSTWTSDAKASLCDVRALSEHTLAPERYRALTMPVLLLVGSESPRDLYATDALAATLPDARVVALEGQAHEGMTTAPALFVDVVTRFLSS